VKKTNDWEIREAKSTDISFIYDSWLKCYKHDSAIGKACRSRIFFDNYKLTIDYLLNHPHTKVLIACNPDERDVLYGYLVCTKGTLHFSLVKEAFRGLGIGRSLFNAAFSNPNSVICSHKTFSVEKIFHTHKQLEFNPFVLFIKEE
jgi:ribosomal protein S18 acetylase RimI-like enzyme